MVQASAAYAALTKMYGQTMNWKSDEPENLFLKMKEDGSLTFEKRGFGISVWFSRKVVPWFSRVIFRRPETHEYDFAENLDAFRKLILDAVPHVQAESVGEHGVQTIEKMIEVYNGLVGSKTRGNSRLSRYVFTRWGDLSGLCQPISAEHVLAKAVEASDQTLMKTIQASFSHLFPEAQAQPESKGGSDPRLSLAVKLVVQGTPERTRVSAVYEELRARVQSIRDAQPSQEILADRDFQIAKKLVNGTPAPASPSADRASSEAMVSYLRKVSSSLDRVEDLVSAEKKEELERLSAKLTGRIRELETYKARGPVCELVATKWIGELQEQQELLRKKSFAVQQGVQEILDKKSPMAFTEAVQAKLTERQVGIEERVRPTFTPSSTFGFVKAIWARVSGKVYEEQILAQASQLNQQAKLYAYTERALARNEWLLSLAKKKGIPTPSCNTQSAASLVQKRLSNPSQIDEKDIQLLFGSFQSIEKANIRMQAQLETIPEQDVALQCALEGVRSFDRFSEVQEKINVLVPIIYDDIWEDHTEHVRSRYSAIAGFFRDAFEEMNEILGHRAVFSREEISKEVEQICELVEKVDQPDASNLRPGFSSVPSFLEQAGVWEFWLKARTGKKDVDGSLQGQFLAMDAGKRSVFIARAMMSGQV
jgi:hypothetical protein